MFLFSTKILILSFRGFLFDCFRFVLTDKQQTQLEVLEKLHTDGVITKIQLERQKVSLGLVPGMDSPVFFLA
jgi:hypothetical protein